MTVHPADLLVYAGGACLERYGRLWRVTRPADRGGEEAAPTFTRATAGTVLDRDGILRSVASGGPRVSWLDLDGDGVRRPCLLVEDARTNLIAESEDLNSWTKNGTPVVTDDAATYGSLHLALVNDDDAGVTEYITTDPGLTGNAVKAVSWFMRAGTSTEVGISLRDETAAANRLQLTVAWSGGVPTPTVDVGTLLKMTLVDSVTKLYRFECQTTSCTAANTHRLYLNPTLATASLTGTVYAGGFQVENAPFPSSYIPTDGATVTRNADVFTLPFYVAPSANLTVHAVLPRPAHADATGTLGVFPQVWGVAKYASRPNLGLNFDSPAREFQARITDSIGASSAVDAAIAAGARLTVTVQFDATTGTVRSNQGAGWSSWSSTPVGALTAWGASTLYLGDGGETVATTPLGGGLYALLVARGAYEPADFTDWLP